MSTTRSGGVLAVLVALLVASSGHAVGGDAGTGGDAGNQPWHAAALAYGSYSGHLQSDGDRDWFAFPSSTTAPSCVSADILPDAPMNATLYVTTPNGSRTVTLATDQGGIQSGGIVVSALRTSYLGLRDGPGAYTFSLASTTLTTTNGEGPAGADAGEALSAAFDTAASCITGDLSSVVDELDIFRIRAAPGDTVYYSAAATRPGLKLDLLDASGARVGPTIGVNEMAGAYTASGGTYYLAAASTDASSTSYMLGLLIGPDPPGQGCRPTCRVSE